MGKRSRKKTQLVNKQNNSFGGGLSNMLIFSGTPSIENIINAQDYGKDTAYTLAYALANKNVVIGRFIQFIADAMNNITLVDKNGDEVLS